MTVREINVITKEETQREMTPEEKASYKGDERSAAQKRLSEYPTYQEFIEAFVEDAADRKGRGATLPEKADSIVSKVRAAQAKYPEE